MHVLYKSQTPRTKFTKLHCNMHISFVIYLFEWAILGNIILLIVFVLSLQWEWYTSFCIYVVHLYSIATNLRMCTFCVISSLIYINHWICSMSPNSPVHCTASLNSLCARGVRKLGVITHYTGVITHYLKALQYRAV